MPTNNNLRSVFTDFENELLLELEAEADFHTFKPGDRIMRTGQYFRSVMLILNGTVKVFREDDEGNEFLVYYLSQGEACTLSMVLPELPQTSEVMGVAETAVEILSIPPHLMDKWMRKYKSWNHYVLNSYRSRLEDLLQTIDQTVFRNMDERLLFYLKRYQATFNTSIITISNTEIAQELNSSREVISRLLKKLAEKGRIRIPGNQQIEIVDLGV